MGAVGESMGAMSLMLNELKQASKMVFGRIDRWMG